MTNARLLNPSFFTPFYTVVKGKTRKACLTQTSVHPHGQLHGTKQFQQSKNHQHSPPPRGRSNSLPDVLYCCLTPVCLLVEITGTFQIKCTSQLYLLWITTLLNRIDAKKYLKMQILALFFPGCSSIYFTEVYSTVYKNLDAFKTDSPLQYMPWGNQVPVMPMLS